MKRMNKKCEYSSLKAGGKARVEGRKKVIEYYRTTGNFCKSATARHFAQLGYARRSIYGICKRYDERGDTATAHKRKGLAPVTLDRIEKYEEIHRKDPTISYAEAAAILKINSSSIKVLRREMFKRQREKLGVAIKSEALGSPDGVDNCDLDESHLSETEMKPEPVPRPTTNFRCFACAEILQKAENTAGVSKNGELSKNLTVIFVLRTLLDLSSYEVVNLLREAKGKSPGEWIGFCKKCHDLVTDALEIQNQIQGLQKKLGECKLNLKEKIRKSNSTTKPNHLATKKKKGVNSEPKQVVKIKERVRKRIRNSEPRRPVNPFIEGDKEAERKCLAMIQVLPFQVEVKHEVEVPEEIPEDSDLPEFELPLAELEHWRVLPDISSEQRKHEMAYAHESNLNAYQPDPETNTGTIVDSSRNSSIVVKREVEAPEEISDGDDTYPPEFEYQPHPGTGASPDVSSSANSAGNVAVLLPVQEVCDICGDSVRSSVLALHKLREHGVLMEGFTEYRCDKEGCKYVTIYKTNYTDHLETHAPNRKKYACRFCGKVYYKLDNLKGHVKRKHFSGYSRPFQCDSCGKSFARKANLKEHIKRVHEEQP